MPRAVLDASEERRIDAEVLDDQARELDVLVLLVRGDVVDLARLALPQDELDCAAMVVDVEPVAHLPSVAVQRQRFAVERVGREERQQLLGVLIRAVRVGAARHRGVHAVRADTGEHLQVTAGLRGAVGARRPQRVVLA